MTRSVRTIVLLAAAALLSRCAACNSSDGEDCASGQQRCEGFCVDPASYQTDPNHCGGCGVACGLGTCSGGTCACEPGATSCPTSIPRCADTQNDRLNCGTCENVCPPNESCASGACECLAPFTTCGSACTSTQTDAANCGACGNVCPLAGDVCVGGECRCPTGELACPTSSPTECVDPATDAANCGSCGNACPSGRACVGGTCQCPTGATPCDGACVDLQTDDAHCGACGNACTSPTRCACGGRCQTQHANGLGQSFIDCQPLGTYDLTQAQSAARAWQPSGTSFDGALFQCPGCLGWRTPSGVTPASCATWCYAGPLQGRVFLVPSLVCTCTTLDPGNWN